MASLEKKYFVRSDMKKVVVERPRRGSRQRNNKFGARLPYVPDHDYDEQPKKAHGFESYTAGSRKWFTDVLGPLGGFLRKNVGRPWDKVYSELSAGLDKRKTTGMHIFQHVKQMVATACYCGADGKVYSIQWGSESQVGGMYVHPRTGLLCETRVKTKREQARNEQQEAANFLRVSNELGYYKHENIWYRVKLEFRVFHWKDRQSPLIWDIFFKKYVKLDHGQYWIPVEKWQCGRRELTEIRRLLAEREKKARGN